MAGKVNREKNETELFRVDCHERISAAEALVAQCTADSEATRVHVLDMQASVDDKVVGPHCIYCVPVSSFDRGLEVVCTS